MANYSQPVAKTGIKIHAASVSNSDTITIPKGFIIDYFLVKAVTTTPVGPHAISIPSMSLSQSISGASSTYYYILRPNDANSIIAVSSSSSVTITITSGTSGTVIYDVTAVLTRS